MGMSYILRLFKEIFFPRQCGVCKAEIDTGLVCECCRKNFLLHKEKVWGADAASWQELERINQPLAVEDYFDRVEYLYRYDGIFKDALHRLKFEAEPQWLPLLKEEAQLALAEEGKRILKHYDLVTCIPTSEARKKQRGFDVPWEIFSCLRDAGKATYTDQLLQRIKNTAPLFALGVEERRNEIAGCFKANAGLVRGKRILLCDDIFTTGTTMQAAAGELFKAGAKSVGVLTLCASKDNWD